MKELMVKFETSCVITFYEVSEINKTLALFHRFISELRIIIFFQNLTNLIIT